MWLARILSSPAHVVATGALGFSLFTCSYNAVVPPSTQPETANRSGAELEPAPAPPSLPPLRVGPAGPYLRHAADPDLLGQPIGIENPESLAHFHESLARAAVGEGQSRILFYGASHVASDSFTGYIRAALQQRYGDAGHGFVLPVHPWRSYVHSGVRVESNFSRWTPLRARATETEVGAYGLAGVAVESAHGDAWGSVATAQSGDVGHRASRFEIYYYRQPTGGEFEVVVDGVPREVISTRAMLPATGYAAYDVPDGAHRLDVRVRGNGVVRIFGVVVERDVPGVVLDTLGINGARARLHLLWEDAIYREHLARRRPDLVVLAYGTNEAMDTRSIEAYEIDLRQVLGRIREIAPRASIVMMGPTDAPVVSEDGAIQDRPRTAELNQVQRRLAYEYGCGYFDLVAFQGGPLSMVRWVEHDPPHGAADYVHFTRPGYQRLAEEFLAAISPPDS